MGAYTVLYIHILYIGRICFAIIPVFLARENVDDLVGVPSHGTGFPNREAHLTISDDPSCFISLGCQHVWCCRKVFSSYSYYSYHKDRSVYES